MTKKTKDTKKAEKAKAPEKAKKAKDPKKAKKAKDPKKAKKAKKTEDPKILEEEVEAQEQQDASGLPVSYYIDFENVHGDGLKGAEALPASAEIVVFYSKAAETFHIQQAVDVMASDARIVFVECDSGTRNSLDFQLLTMLFGTMSADREYVIVTEDTGFDAAIKMAGRLGLPKVVRCADVSGSPCKPKARKAKKTKKAKKAQAAPEVQQVQSEPAAEQAQSEPEAQQAQSESEAQQAKRPAKRKKAADGASAAKEKSPQAKAESASAPAPARTRKKHSYRRKVAEALDCNGITLTRQQLSTVMKALNESENLQSFYQIIIKEEGREHGLELYRLVKSSCKPFIGTAG